MHRPLIAVTVFAAALLTALPCSAEGECMPEFRVDAFSVTDTDAPECLTLTGEAADGAAHLTVQNACAEAVTITCGFCFQPLEVAAGETTTQDLSEIGYEASSSDKSLTWTQGSAGNGVINAAAEGELGPCDNGAKGSLACGIAAVPVGTADPSWPIGLVALAVGLAGIARRR